jgi:hypothetical protein
MSARCGTFSQAPLVPSSEASKRVGRHMWVARGTESLASFEVFCLLLGDLGTLGLVVWAVGEIFGGSVLAVLRGGGGGPRRAQLVTA